MSNVEAVRRLIAEVLRVPLDSVLASSRLADVATLDSLSLAEIASALDDAFGTRVPADELSTALTISELEELVARSPRR